MRATMLPDMEAKLTSGEASHLLRQIVPHLANIKTQWLNREIRKIVPPEIYMAAHNQHGKDDEFIWRNEKVKKWLDDHDIRIEEKGVHARIFQGAKLLHQLLVRVVDE